MRTHGAVGSLVCLAMFAVPDAAGAASLVPGNLVAAVIDATGVIPAPTYIAEYQTSGTRVQTLANVPQPGGTARTQDRVFDLVHGPGNAIHLYNGSRTRLQRARRRMGTPSGRSRADHLRSVNFPSSMPLPGPLYHAIARSAATGGEEPSGRSAAVRRSRAPERRP